MTLSFGRILADAWAAFRRESDLVVRIAAPFVFLPAFAVRLLTDPFPAFPTTPRDPATMQRWAQAVSAWGEANIVWHLIAAGLGLYGAVTLALLLLDPGRPDVRGALGIAARRFPRFALASILVAIPVGIGAWFFILPGLYAQARLIATLPLLAAAPRMPALRGLARSVRMTRGAGLAIFGTVAAVFLAHWLALQPLEPIAAWLRAPGQENPFVLALVEAALAAIVAAYQVAVLLIGVAVYRRLGSSGT